jgi:hypothetical protein
MDVKVTQFEMIRQVYRYPWHKLATVLEDPTSGLYKLIPRLDPLDVVMSGCSGVDIKLGPRRTFMHRCTYTGTVTSTGDVVALGCDFAAIRCRKLVWCAIPKSIYGFKCDEIIYVWLHMPSYMQLIGCDESKNTSMIPTLFMQGSDIAELVYIGPAASGTLYIKEGTMAVPATIQGYKVHIVEAAEYGRLLAAASEKETEACLAAWKEAGVNLN